MELYLSNDLVKASIPATGGMAAVRPAAAPAAPSATPKAPSTPSAPGGAPEGMQPCSVGGGQQCLEAGGNGAEYHKTGGSIEQKHSQYRASQGGTGVVQEESAVPKIDPGEVKDTVQDTAPSMAALQANAVAGVNSTNPEHYPEDSDPYDHYQVAHAIEAQGNGSDSAKEIAEGHRNIARQRSEKMSGDEHRELSQKLGEAGHSDASKYHSDQADQADKLQAEKDEGLKAAEGVVQDVEGRAAEKEEEARPVQEEAAGLGEKIESKKKAAEEDSYEAAMQAHEDEKAKIDQQHAEAMTEHAAMTREHREHEKKASKLKDALSKHKRKDPGKFEEERPSKSEDESGEAFSAKVKAWKKRAADHKDKQKVHKEELKKLQYELEDHKNNAPEKPGKPPKHPGYPDEPDPEDHGGKKAESAKEKAAVADHSGRASSLRENVRSHLENNQDLSDSDREKLQQVHDALGEHAERDRVPTSQHGKDLKDLEKLAGDHGKAAHQEAQGPVAPSNTIEEAQVADHAYQASSAIDNIDAHLAELDSDIDLTPEEREAVKTKLQKVKEGLAKHKDQKHVPSGEQAKELKELLKLAGEHGKKPPETQVAEGEDSPEAKKTAGKKVNYAAVFESGRRAGTSLGRAAATAEGAGSIGSDVLNYGASGVMSSGQKLLNSPRRPAKDLEAEKQAQQSAVDKMSDPKKQAHAEKTLGEQEAAKRTDKSMSDLYLDFDADLNLLKAVQVPNSGTTTMSDTRAKRRIKTSYAEHPVGVMGGSGIAQYDDPDVGRKWKHDPDESVSAELEEEREAEKEEDDDDVSKAMLFPHRNLSSRPSGVSILTNLNKSLSMELEPVRYNPREIEFMTEVMGVSNKDIKKGLVSITGRNRHRFHEWLIDRMNKTIGASVG